MHILIVDSRRPIVTALRTILEPEGFVVRPCSGTDEALVLLAHEKPDVCLLGVEQAQPQGAERAAVQIERLRDQVPLALVVDSPEDSEDGPARTGVDKWINLQWPPQRIIETLREWGNGGSNGVPAALQNIIGQCPQMQALFQTIRKVAASPSATVLIRGESGTGKELVARAIHDLSPNASQPFVEINCAAVPENLLESELFGYERGAFTDAKQTKRGLLELAEHGTFFMDEIGDLNHRLQIKLVKALEEKTFRRLGGTRDISVTMRLMTATNRDLEKAVNEGNFREDLYYRLNVVSLTLPPLRERGSDILLLAEHFLRLFNLEHGRSVRGFSREAERLLLDYPWPGNVRELKNAIERAVLLGGRDRITPAQLSLGRGHIVKDFPLKVENNSGSGIKIDLPPQGLSLIELEKAAIRAAMEMAHGNQCQAARLLQISRETLRYRLRKHRLAGGFAPDGGSEPSS